jgi:3-methylcrotonyl-CoA carboxylase alpha subunit
VVPLFKTVLIANRGEISCRISRTAQRMGIRSVAVYSDADSGALHTRVADEAVRIGPPSARESYLDLEALLGAARATGAEAIHPGYGFLSQSAEFAQACADAGIRFVGPSPQAIRLMGVKDQAKDLMRRAGVPVVPGYLGESQEDATLTREAARVGFPLLVKAIAGGGGKGMRVVATPAELPAALAAARGEAERAFGDGRIMLERYVRRARHVEVQVIADSHGNTLHLLERDCSLQRRYQKIIEEAPAPGLSPALRRRLHEAAVAAARAVGYENAGTVEFVLAADEFFFLEMNTRLQVEHPVTEAILGLDLVELQLRIAAGEPLPISQTQVQPRGHAFEARIYAEDPRRSFLPAGGRAHALSWPRDARIDAALEAGDRVVVDYDALLAKLIVHAADRPSALSALERALRASRVEGVTTNLAALVALAADPQVAAADVYTRLIDERGDELLPSQSGQAERAARLAASALLAAQESAPEASPWDRTDGWSAQGGAVPLVRLQAPDGRDFVLHGASSEADADATSVERDRVTVWLDGERHMFHRVSGDSDCGGSGAQGVVRAPMPGLILAVNVKDGEAVSRGQALVVMEAMKMEHTLAASADGRVTELRIRKGDRVRDGDQLLRLEA